MSSTPAVPVPGNSLPTQVSSSVPPHDDGDERRSEFGWKTHGYLGEHIRFADTKAAIAIAWTSAFVGFLFTSEVHHFFTWSHFSREIDLKCTALAITSLLAFLLLAAGFICAALTVRPRLGTKQPVGFIYWQSILAHEKNDAFAKALSSEPMASLDRHVAEHVFDLAGICHRKYFWLTLSIWFALSGTVLGAIVMLFVK
jgi:hypothetical protein